MLRSVTVSRTVGRSAEDVFDFLVDNRNDEQWCPLASDVELVEGTPGVGALYRYRQARPGQRPFTTWLRTTVAERPARLEWTDDGRGMGYHATIELHAAGDRTRVVHTNRVRMPDPLQQAMWFAGANAVLRRQLRNLQKALQP